MASLRMPLALLALALIAACAPAPRTPVTAPRLVQGAAPVSIQVTNDLLSEARVYLMRSAVERRPLGTVLAGHTGQFTVPARLICGLDVRLAVVPIDGTGGYATEEFVAWPGQGLAFRLRENGAVRFPNR